MAVYHSKNLVIMRDDLRQIADARLIEYQELLEAQQFAGAMFLGGCALECDLKLAVCLTLKLDGLPTAFKTHDLEALLLYSGYDSLLRNQENGVLKQSFDIILDAWKPDGRETLLYGDPAKRTEKAAKSFMDALRDPKIGVIPWLQEMMS